MNFHEIAVGSRSVPIRNAQKLEQALTHAQNSILIHNQGCSMTIPCINISCIIKRPADNIYVSIRQKLLFAHL